MARGEGSDIVGRRHPEWQEFQRRWRWLGDSLEGGDRYRYADYLDPIDGPRSHGIGMGSSDLGSLFGPVGRTSDDARGPDYNLCLHRNLIPHKSETGRDNRGTYELRLLRTPVPKLMERVERRHLSRIYAREVQRTGPPLLTEWWGDVDGIGSTMDQWMRKVAAPLLVTYGHLDILFDHPVDDDESMPLTRQDVRDRGLDACLVSHILPENMLWWRLDRRCRYLECLVLERDDEGKVGYRHWTNEGSTLYDRAGEVITPFVPHPFGRVPILRVFDERNLRCRNIGKPRYESIAEYQKAIYNAMSEEILADVLQSHPTLCAHEDLFSEGKGELFVGADSVIKTRDVQGIEMKPWFLEPPKGPIESLGKHKDYYADEIVQDASLTKPAGTTTAGTSGGGPVAQSGISKVMDSQSGNDYLAEIAATLGDAESQIAAMVLLVLSDGQIDADLLDQVSVIYPKEFDLFTADDLATAIADIQGLAAAQVNLPILQGELMNRLIRLVLPGLEDDTFQRISDELEGFLTDKAEMATEAREAGANGINALAEANQTGDPDDDQTIAEDEAIDY